MDDEQQSGLLSIIKNIIETCFRLVSDLAQLAKLEAQLAGRSLVKILALSFVIGTFITSTWLCILALIVYYLRLEFSWPITLSLVIVLNLFSLGLIVAAIVTIKKNLFFPATRRQLSVSADNLKKEPMHE